MEILPIVYISLIRRRDMVIYDKTVHPARVHNSLMYSAEVENGIVVREWSWVREGNGGVNGPLGLIGMTVMELREHGFHQRPRVIFYD